jgi:hypothetical protein
MKTIKTTHIDTGGHGYLSVSKEDLLLVLTPDQVSRCSGHSLTRMYLEEDLDASLFMNTAEAKGIKVEVKSSYNEHFKCTHNYKPELFYWHPVVGNEVEISGNGWFTISKITDTKFIVGRYGVPLSNPFEWVIGDKRITELKEQLKAQILGQMGLFQEVN